MPKLIISTVGTSMFTNFDRDNTKKIIQISNYKEFKDEDLKFIDGISSNLKETIKQNDKQFLSKISAEMNGLLRIDADDEQDMYYFLLTDTYLGKRAGELINFIMREKLNKNNLVIKVVNKLNTSGINDFYAGIRGVLEILYSDEIIGFRKSNYEIVFNLTGGFKSVQAMLNTIGMFVADKMYYIFESSEELIEIPKLPIKLDNSVIEQNYEFFLLLKAGSIFSVEEFEKRRIPKLMYFSYPGEGKAMLDVWGELMFNEAKENIIINRGLPKFERIIYDEEFKKDFKLIKNVDEKIKSIMAIAKVVHHNLDGDAMRKDNILQYETMKYLGNDIDHFRTGYNKEAARIFCRREGASLRFLYYAYHRGDNYIRVSGQRI